MAFGEVLLPIRTRTFVGWAGEFENRHKLPVSTIPNFQVGVTFNVRDQRHTPNGRSLQEHHGCAGRVVISSRYGHVAAANQLALVFGQLMDENLLFTAAR